MNEKIMQMVKLAIENGTISQKHRDLILKKAREVGEDPDLVELYLDNELAKQSAPHVVTSQEAKGLKKCPHCGAVIEDVCMKCPECGYVFSGLSANAYLKQLGDELKSASSQKRKRQIIESVAVPNNKEDLLDFLLMLKPLITDKKDPLSKAYFVKFAECVSRGQHFFRNDKDFSEYIDLYDKLLAQRRKAKVKWCIAFVAIACLLAGFLLVPPFIAKKRYLDNVTKFRNAIAERNIPEMESSIRDILHTPASYEAKYNLSDISDMLKDELHKVADENKDSRLADSLIMLVYRLPREDRFKSKGENWDCVRAVAGMNYDRNENEEYYRVISLFDNDYPDDQTALQYILINDVKDALLRGSKKYAYQLADRAYQFFDGYPAEIQDAEYDLLVDIIEKTARYPLFGYFLGEGRKIVGFQSPVLSESGVEIGDVLIDNEEALKSERMAAAMEGRKFKHTFLRGGDTVRVSLPYLLFDNWN